MSNVYKKMSEGLLIESDLSDYVNEALLCMKEGARPNEELALFCDMVNKNLADLKIGEVMIVIAGVLRVGLEDLSEREKKCAMIALLGMVTAPDAVVSSTTN